MTKKSTYNHSHSHNNSNPPFYPPIATNTQHIIFTRNSNNNILYIFILKKSYKTCILHFTYYYLLQNEMVFFSFHIFYFADDVILRLALTASAKQSKTSSVVSQSIHASVIDIPYLSAIAPSAGTLCFPSNK